MASEIGVLIVHGIGVQEANFAGDFIAAMNDRLDDLQVARGLVKWEPAYWADLLTAHEVRLWEDLSRSHNLSWESVRKFIINVLADAVAYQRKPGQAHDMYRAIHARIHEHLVRLRDSLGNQDRPLVVVAHSLGSVIMSNYIWDEQHQNGLGNHSFERMETLAGLVTFGSNIPLFTLALPEVACIAFPPAQLPDPLKAKAKWLNFFDAADVLGYPLKPLSPAFGKTVTADLEINAGSLFISWNPISHIEYWTDADFTTPVAQLVSDILFGNGTSTP